MTAGDDSRSRLRRLAVVTTSAPPSASGQARVLEKLLSGGAGTDSGHVFLSDQVHLIDKDSPGLGAYVSLAAPRYQLVSTLTQRSLQVVNNVGGLARDSFSRSREIVTAIRRQPVDVVVGCSGNPFDLPAAYLAARHQRLPFVAYLFDDPVFQWEAGIYRRLGRFWERIWGPRASAVITPNEILSSDFLERVPSASVHIVRNPVDEVSFLSADEGQRRPPPTAQEPWTLVYTGSVYSAQESAFRNLVAALDQIGGAFKLVVYTSQSESQVRSCGLVGPHVERRDHLPHAEAIRAQQAADILFLPLAFDSPIPEVIRSSAPAKVGEYLASGRPVLVHAPTGSFVTELFRRKQAGVVVDTPSVGDLVGALRTIAKDPDQCCRLTANARSASEEFKTENARAAFWSVMRAVHKS